MSTGARQCKMTNRRGKPCGMAPVEGSAFCFNHDPGRATERARSRRKGGEHRRTATASPLPSAPPSLGTVSDVQHLLETAVYDTLQQENSDRRSRALAALCGVALRCFELGGHEERLTALEERLAILSTLSGKRQTSVLGKSV
jgi:hypothetical protein